MHRSNRSTALRIPSTRPPRLRVRLVDALICAHREQLVQVARHHLGNQRRDADDVVQDVCLAAVEGELLLSSDPTEALDELLQAVISAALTIRESGGT
jgi:hypothetical protein